MHKNLYKVFFFVFYLISNLQYLQSQSFEDITRATFSLTSDIQLYNETVVAFIPNATTGYDTLYDALKVIGNANISLYTKAVGLNFTIQSLPPLEQDYLVQLGMICMPNIGHTLRLKKYENFPPGACLYLIDHELDSIQYLLLDTAYYFMPGSMPVNVRFDVVFTPEIKVNALSETCAGQDGQLQFQLNSTSAQQVWVHNTTFDINCAHLPALLQDTIVTNLPYGNYSITCQRPDGVLYSKNVEIDYGWSIHIQPSVLESSLPLAQATFQFFLNPQTDVVALWDFGDNSPTSNLFNPVHTYLDTGVYKVIVNTYNAFCQRSDTLTVKVFATINQDTIITNILQLDNNSLVFPNPARPGQAIFGLPKQEFNTHYWLANVSGKIFSMALVGNQYYIPDGLPFGVYFVYSEKLQNAQKPIKITVYPW